MRNVANKEASSYYRKGHCSSYEPVELAYLWRAHLRHHPRCVVAATDQRGAAAHWPLGDRAFRGLFCGNVYRFASVGPGRSSWRQALSSSRHCWRPYRVLSRNTPPMSSLHSAASAECWQPRHLPSFLTRVRGEQASSSKGRRRQATYAESSRPRRSEHADCCFVVRKSNTQQVMRRSNKRSCLPIPKRDCSDYWV